MQTGNRHPHIVVVGGGFAGIETIKTLKRAGIACSITLVSKKEYFEYYPALYKLVTGALAIEVALPLTDIFPRGVTITKATFTGIDLARQVALIDGGKEIVYDYLVVALGSETNYFNIAGLPELSYSFKSVAEALRLKRHFCELFASCAGLTKEEMVTKLNVLIVGGGPSGVELAGDLTHYLRRLAKEFAIDPSLISIDVIEASGRLLPMLPEKVSRIAERRLRSLGVNLYLNRALQSQDIEQVVLKDIQLKSTTVIWTAGTRINSAYQSIPGVTFDTRKRVVVNECLALPSDNHIFIIGDGAATPFSGLAQTAIHHGAYLGRHIARLAEGKKTSPYIPKKNSFVIPIGSNWALLVMGNTLITGLIPWLLRSIIDFQYFTSIVSLRHVLGAFRKGHKYRKHVTACPVGPGVEEV